MLFGLSFELTLLLTNLLHIPTQQIDGTNRVIGQIVIYLCDWLFCMIGCSLFIIVCLHLNLRLSCYPKLIHCLFVLCAVYQLKL